MLPASTSSTTAPDWAADNQGIGGHPRGLTTLFFTEMWERFSYHGMRALLVLFMTLAVADGGLGFATAKATAIYGTYTMSVYLLCILGGFLADNFIGARRAVLGGGIIIALGHFSMAVPSIGTFYLGLSLIAIGTGLLKPNISTMVGGLYSTSDTRRDAGFSIFYMGINLGAFLSAIVCGYLAQGASFQAFLTQLGVDPRSSWHFAFAAAGFGMTFGLITYVRRRATLAHVGQSPVFEPGQARPWSKLGLVALGSLVLIAIMVLADRYKAIVIGMLVAQIIAILFFAFRPSTESRRMAAILILFFAAQIFWALFEQAGSSVQLFADRLTDNSIFGWTFPSAWWQSVNSVFVILLAPVFAWLWFRLGTRSPSSPTKFALGLLFVALSFIWMIPAAKLTAGGLVSPVWLIGLFFLQTTGEMCLSPVGLSTMTKLAPAQLTGLVMGIWFLAAALGNKIAGLLAGGFDESDPTSLVQFFLTQAMWVGVATVLLFALVPWVKRLMGGVH